MKIICIRKNIKIFCSNGKKNLLFLPSNMAAEQNLYNDNNSYNNNYNDNTIFVDCQYTFFACTFCFLKTDQVLILSRLAYEANCMQF